MNDAGRWRGEAETVNERQLPCFGRIQSKSPAPIENPCSEPLPMREQRLGVENGMLRLT
jgi:hypothetical protein